MWDYDSLIGKASRYFKRAAQASSDSECDVMATWLLLGVELLIRAGLAETSPALNADPIFMVDAVRGQENAKAKTIPISTAIERLTQLLPPTAESDLKAPAIALINLRNAELHSGMAALDIDAAGWLPSFTRVVDIICAHLGVEAKDIVGDEIIGWGRTLVDKADQAVIKEVNTRIKPHETC
ncbi:hypothetical protein [Microbispora siamensis]|uniref:DUF4145 domain-containing protein n=1 Tax=Microbispora siamensis TaxID=564413 RepID=A0ABQ4GM89_9ACTN|nr:hypothetical protein [Microbispora siamensis]GIH62543.1 hypothetical protein Msi02_33600 [Microbispora siamensis]